MGTAGAFERVTARLAREDPLELALLRIAVALLMGTSAEVWSPMALDAQATALQTPPEGLAWFARLVPVTGGLVLASRVVAVASATTGALGLFSRASFAALSAAGFYLFACSELVSAARHDMHLLWFSLLLALSPSGAALSLDARRPGRTAVDAVAVGVPVWTVRALLAVVYFFPGYWKLREAGFGWAMGDNLANQMHWKWFQNAWRPAFRIDRYPTLVRGGALSVLLLELAFPLLVLTRRGRLLAALFGFSFHAFAEQFLRLGFASLWWCYSVLIAPRRLVRWLHDEDVEPEAAPLPPPRFRSRALLAAAGLLVSANVAQGFRGAVQAFPFACYPTFQWVTGRDLPDLEVRALTSSGAEVLVEAGTRGVAYRSQRDWGIVWQLLGEYGREPRAAGLRAFYEREIRVGRAAPPPPGTQVLRFYRAEFDTTPERAGAPPVRRALVAETPLR